MTDYSEDTLLVSVKELLERSAMLASYERRTPSEWLFCASEAAGAVSKLNWGDLLKRITHLRVRGEEAQARAVTAERKLKFKYEDDQPAEPRQAKPMGLVSHELFEKMSWDEKETLAEYFQDEGLITWYANDMTGVQIKEGLKKHVRSPK